jgi:hypothetical protein
MRSWHGSAGSSGQLSQQERSSTAAVPLQCLNNNGYYLGLETQFPNHLVRDEIILWHSNKCL